MEQRASSGRDPVRPQRPTGWSDLRDRRRLGSAANRLAASLPRTPRARGGSQGWDVDVVAEGGPTRTIWHDTVQDFAEVLSEAGGFRRIRTHTLGPEAARNPGTLPRAAEGRLILLLTDGLSPAWHGPGLRGLLRRWAEDGPLALVHLLLEGEWKETALLVRDVELRSPRPAAANRRLRWRTEGPEPEPRRGRGLPVGPGLPIPVLRPEGEWLDSWAALLAPTPAPDLDLGLDPAADRSGWTKLPVVFTGALAADPPRAGADPSSPAERVQRLRATVSQDVFELACLLAATPLTLSLARAVQRALLPGSRVSDLARLLLHGVLLPTGRTGRPPAAPEFDFGPGLREQFLAAGRSDTLRRVVQVVGEQVAGTEQAELWRLPGLLDGGRSDAAPAVPVSAATLPWVAVERAVLHALSGEFLAPARELDLAIAAYDRRAERADAAAFRPRTPTAQKGRTTVTEQPTTDQGRTAQTTPTVWGNIPPRNPNFTGREDLLEALHQRLLKEKTTAVLPHALHGMGGVGKSLLAIEYLYRRLGDYDVVWWITAERTAQIVLSLVELAPRLGIQPSGDSSSTVAAVIEALRLGRPYRNWLLVFDNAESPEAVSSYFPSGGPGNILVTSRNPQWASIARPLEVDVFLREESKQLLRVRGPEISDEDADRLAEALGDLPLAIEQAAAWHAETGMLADEYLRLLSEKRLDLLAVSAPLDYQLPVIAAWNISLDQLETKNPAALQLLQVCSFCAPEPISRLLFSRMQGRPIAPELDAALEDPIRLGQVIREIGRYSLARFDHRTNSIQMHRLVQTALLARMTEEDQARMRHGTHLLLSANDPNDPLSVDRWRRYGELYPHVVVSGAVHSSDPWARKLVINEVRYQIAWGDYESGRSLAQLAYDSWRQSLGADHAQTLEVARWLGFLLFSMGRYTEAASLNAVVLEAYRRSFGADHQDTVDATGNVAVDRRVQGQFTEALDLSRAVHRRYVRLIGPGEPETLRAAHNLGVSLRLSGDFAAARAIDEETWHSWIQIYGQDHVDSLRTWLGLILDIRELGDYSGALTYHREIVEQTRNLLGAKNPLTLSCARHLAVALRKAGQHPEALDAARQAKLDLDREYGHRNPESLAAALELTSHLRHPEGSVLVHPLDLGRSLEQGSHVLEHYRDAYGETHPHTLSAAVNLAVTRRLAGTPELALEADQRALEEFRERLGPDHPSTLICQTNLASDLYALGDIRQALTLDRLTLGRSRELFSDDHPSTLACAVNLSMDLQYLGETAEAEELHTTTLERLRRVLGDDHPAVGQAESWDRRADCDIDPMPL